MNLRHLEENEHGKHERELAQLCIEETAEDIATLWGGRMKTSPLGGALIIIVSMLATMTVLFWFIWWALQ